MSDRGELCRSCHGVLVERPAALRRLMDARTAQRRDLRLGLLALLVAPLLSAG